MFFCFLMNIFHDEIDMTIHGFKMMNTFNKKDIVHAFPMRSAYADGNKKFHRHESLTPPEVPYKQTRLTTDKLFGDAIYEPSFTGKSTTPWNGPFCRTLDYIRISEKMSVDSITLMADKVDDVALPSATHGSDHLPVEVVLSF